jgi:hypothetical protein
VAIIVELGLDVVSGAALPVAVLFYRIFRIRVAALDHEFFDDPVENRPVVKALARQFLEILDRVWRGISPKLYHHIAFARLYHSHFVG